jgi:hypothetical protein
MAFGRQCMGDIGIGTMDQKIPANQRRYEDFFRDQFEHYKDVENIADVAVLYSYASMGFNNDAPAVSFMLFTQALIQARVPFNIIFDEHLKDLSRYKALVLADQECLSEEQMELIRKYVQQGGGLVATEQTSLYTPWRLLRPDFGLKDLFRVSAPKAGQQGRERDLEIPAVQNHIGQGRVSYVAAVRAAIEKPAGARMTSQYWKLPLNWKEITEQVRWAAGGKFTLEVEAPETLVVVGEQQEQMGQNRRLVHLLNYAAPQGKTVSNVKVEVELPEGKGVRQVTLLTPDAEGEKAVPSQVAGGQARFTVPHLETYTLAVIQME